MTAAPTAAMHAGVPWVDCYRFRKPFPRRLLYRNGALELEIAEVPVDVCRWRFRARKLNQAQSTVDICIASTRHELDRRLHSDGFPLDGNFASPARKIMDRLVHEGYAVTGKVKH